MATVSAGLTSPTAASPTSGCGKGTAGAAYMAARPPALSRSSSFPSRAGGGAKPSLMERRSGRPSPGLGSVNAFHSAGVDASAEPPAVLEAKPALTLYDVLNVPPSASENEIRSAYRRLARQYHPDVDRRGEASTTKFLQIHDAYATLSDPPSRATYDLQLSLTAFQSAGYKGRFSRARDYYSPSSSTVSSPSSYCSPRTPYSTGRGKSWETDQCWC